LSWFYLLLDTNNNNKAVYSTDTELLVIVVVIIIIIIGSESYLSLLKSAVTAYACDAGAEIRSMAILDRSGYSALRACQNSIALQFRTVSEHISAA